jgi:proline-specific peptidase
MPRSTLLALVTALAACSGDRGRRPTVPRGEARLAVPGGSIWYKVSGTGSGTPVVLLHGGPGFSSYYLKPFEDLSDERVVVRYDQLGSGKSDTTSDTTLFTIGHFVNELDSLRSHLGVGKWHVLGHSWGTILAIEYYRAHPERVVSLTFGSPVFDIPAYERRANELVATLSDASQRAVRKALATAHYDTPGYQNAINEFYGLYLFRHPVQADLDSSFAAFNQAIYVYMQGPSEFTITGTLKQYDATPFLPQIHVPTLVTVGEFDEVGPELVRSHSHQIPAARYVQLAGAAHLTSWDAREANLQAVREFLRSADSVSVGPRR